MFFYCTLNIPPNPFDLSGNNHRCIKFYSQSCDGIGGESGWYIRNIIFLMETGITLE
jgi:hypothetical protein